MRREVAEEEVRHHRPVGSGHLLDLVDRNASCTVLQVLQDDFQFVLLGDEAGMDLSRLGLDQEGGEFGVDRL